MNAKNLSLGQKIAYALPGAPIAALSLPILVYLPPFYESLGLSLSLVGLIFMLNRLWDVVTDPVLGVVTDRLPSRWGRRRHWLAISAPILMISTYMIFIPPAEVSGTYLGVWLFILYLGYTLITLSHMSWGTELSSNYNERSTIHGIREIAIILGMLTAISLPAILEVLPWAKSGEASFGLGEKVAAMGVYVLILLPLCLFIALWKIGEIRAPAPPKIEWNEVYHLLINNRPMRKLLSADLLISIAIGMTGSLYLYFYSSFLNLGKYSSALLLFYFLSGCMAVPFWIKLAHKLGKHRTLSIACIYSASVLPLILIMPKESLMWGVLSTSLYGIGSGAGPFLARSMMSDITDKHNLETGSQRTGLFFAALSLTNKVGGALAVGIAYITLDLINFVPYDTNSEEAIFQISVLYVWVPALCLLPIASFMWNYPFSITEQEECRRLIDERDNLNTDTPLG